jgi:2-C-methyl-D-erythritol 4-phosphate cytidylyltransferase
MTRRERAVPSIAVLVPAGGLGTRLGRRTPKQFLRVGGVSVLARTLRHFLRYPGVRAIVVAAPAGHLARTRQALRRAGGRPIVIVPGGSTRQESVWRALQAAPADVDILLVHDAVRPFIDRRLVDAVIDAASERGAAICALPIAETIKRVQDGVVETTVDRAGLWAVQTPQAFRAEVLREAHDKARREGVVGTDDAMLVERLGQPIRVVMGLAGNVKITTPEDLRRARRRR